LSRPTLASRGAQAPGHAKAGCGGTGHHPGSGTSIAVAEALTRLGTPFLFATGYGDSVSIPTHLKQAPVVRKPYDAASILSNLERLLD